MKNKILDAKNYLAFKEALLQSNCKLCDLSRSRTHIVVDRGNPNARVLIVGEAPGKNEDLQGRVFVGRAGKLLDGLLLELGFDTNEHSLVINVVKCRPPDNRAPKPTEVDACRSFIKKQIDLVRPDFILLLGATALRHLIPDKGAFTMRDEVGKFFAHQDFGGIQMMALFHPAYILRDPRKKPAMIAHLKTFTDNWKSAF